MPRSFWKLFVAVSGLGAISFMLVVEGAKRGEVAALVAGLLVGIPVAAGVLALGRIVVVTTRRGRE